MRTAILSSIVLVLFSAFLNAAVEIPANTAYIDPHTEGARISRSGAITGWTDSDAKIHWYGQIKQPGSLTPSLRVRLKPGSSARLQLTVANQSRVQFVESQTDEPFDVRFGSFNITHHGYHSFLLESLNTEGQPNPEILTLTLDGPAAEEAHFNLNPRRNAASVHLSYPVPQNTRVAAFYCEMTALEDPIHSYYMACGWHRGYFGMQVNSPTERRIIFSVWDSGGEAVDRKKVGDENRVTLVGKGEGVYSGDFGNEGTGGHSHLKFPWKTGENQRFLVTAQPVDQTFTIFAGYYFHPEKMEWMLISSWKAPKEGLYLRGLYSFSENFVGSNGHLLRKALYGNQRIRTAEGEWIEITTANFSHDPTGKTDRLDRFMGVEDNQFFLSHGGFLNGYTEYGTPFERPPSTNNPALMKLPSP